MSEILWRGGEVLVEQPDSPKWKFGDTVTCARRIKGPYDLCLSSAPMKGAFMVGPYLGMRVTDCSVERERGSIGVLTFTLEGRPVGSESPDVPEPVLPDDECEVDAVQQDFPLEQHPNYSGLPQAVLEAVRGYTNAANETDRGQYWPKLVNNPPADELGDKMLHGQASFILFAPVYEWTSYFWDEPTLSTGGNEETPYGPITPPAGWVWLRYGDKLSYNGQHWKLTRKWVGSFKIDHDIYPVPL